MLVQSGKTRNLHNPNVFEQHEERPSAFVDVEKEAYDNDKDINNMTAIATMVEMILKILMMISVANDRNYKTMKIKGLISVNSLH